MEAIFGSVARLIDNMHISFANGILKTALKGYQFKAKTLNGMQWRI